MNCRGWNLQMALYVEGDLEPEFGRPLEQHLAGCEECRSFAAALRESQAEVRQLRSEAVPAASLNRVRMSRYVPRQRQSRQWRHPAPAS